MTEKPEPKALPPTPEPGSPAPPKLARQPSDPGPAWPTLASEGGCDRCGAEMFRVHAVWRCPRCGFKTDCCGW